MSWSFSLAVIVVAAIEAFVFGALIVGDAGFADNEAIHVAAAIGFAALLIGSILALPSRRLGVAAAAQALAAVAAVLVTAAIVGDPNNVGGQAGPFDPMYAIVTAPVVALASWRLRRADALALAPAVSLVVLALVAAPLLGWYGIDAALDQRNSFPPASDPHHNGHWMAVAILAFALPLAGVTAALRLDGWRVMASQLAVVAAGFGVGAVVWPTAPSSLGVAFGAMLTTGALVYGAIAWRLGNRGVARRPRRVGPAAEEAPQPV